MRCTTASSIRPYCILLRRLDWVLFAAVCLCGPFFAAGQDTKAQNPAAPPSVSSAVRQPDVSKEAVVWDKIYTRVRMEADGTGTRQTTGRARILADSGVKEMAILTFTYTASNQQADIGYVRVIKPNGTVVVTPDYNVQDMPADVTRQAPMYSDIHQKHVAVKGLGVGDTLETQVTLRTLKPEVPGQFWMEYTFEKNLIIIDEQLDIDLPADKFVTVASAGLPPTVTTAIGRKLYHWSNSNLARPDPDAPPKSTKHWKPSVQVTTFSSWEQVGAWYDSLQRESLAVTPAIQAKAEALTKGLTGSDEKLRVIFNDVALHIHYVGLDFGIGRYQPHPAEDVLSNEYGDCKDKHTLLASLLKAAGIEAWPVLISSARELDPATPSPAQFDHVITLVPMDGKLLWMDSTEEVAPVGLLADSLRDKQALAIPVGKPAYLQKTSDDSFFPRAIHVHVEGKLSDQGLFTGHIAHTVSGDVGAIYRAAFRKVPQSEWKELLQNLAHYEGYAGEVSNPQISEVEQINQPFQISCDYTREKYDQWKDQESSHWITPPLPPMGGELAPGVKDKKPADEIDLGSTGETVYHSTLQLPAGWIMTPPKDVDLKEDWLEYHAKYSFKDGIFTADRTAVVMKTKVPLEQWEKYLAFRRGMFEDLNNQTLISPSIHTVQNGQKTIIGSNGTFMVQGRSSGLFSKDVDDELRADMQLLRDASAILEASTPASQEDIAKAVGLSRKAVNAIEAESLKLSPDDANSLYWVQFLSSAWSIRGWSALEAKDLVTAESYLRAAWQLSQDKISGYQFGRMLEAKGDKTAAAHQYELAHVSSINNSLGGFTSFDLEDRIAESYKKLTGKEITTTALNRGFYNGSLRAELDKPNEVHGLTPTSQLNGEALYSVAYEADKPAKALMLQGEKGFMSLSARLEGHSFHILLPAGSKARLLREVRVMCSSYGGGCDAYMLLPSALHIPAKDITPPDAPKGTKTLQIQVQ